MAKLTPIQYEDGSNSLTEFIKELVETHPGQEELYLAPLIRVIKEFEELGPLININHKNFPPYKDLKSIVKGLAELRTHKCRYFIYKIDKFEWIGLHGYEKKSNEMPEKEKVRAKGEVKRWQSQKRKE